MKKHPEIIYVVEEYVDGNIQSSKLETTSVWLAFADALIKIRSDKRKGMNCITLPTTKTRTINPNIVFFNAFLTINGHPTKEVRISTKPSKLKKSQFDRSKTNDYYLSDSYIQALRGLIRHIKQYLNNDKYGLLTLLTFASMDDNHILWDKYTPNSKSDSLKLEDIKEVKANF